MQLHVPELFRRLDYILNLAFPEQIERPATAQPCVGLMKKTFCIHSSC